MFWEIILVRSIELLNVRKKLFYFKLFLTGTPIFRFWRNVFSELSSPFASDFALARERQPQSHYAKCVGGR